MERFMVLNQEASKKILSKTAIKKEIKTIKGQILGSFCSYGKENLFVSWISSTHLKTERKKMNFSSWL